ncbi:MAG: hypothetical protein RO257_07965 [Candidatus Kapabacteria bacterium]|jgi:hypothetical protein|nr:hypothetical protein [Candidatus Kapabacteria bacterium]
MALIKEKRIHRFSDGDLIELTISISGSMRMHLADLMSFGISQADIDALLALSEDYMRVIKDKESRLDIYSASDNRDKLKENIKEEIRMMAIRCRLKWGNGSTQEKSLGIKGMAGFTDENLFFTANLVHSAMSENLSELSVYGLTQEILDNFENMIKSYEEAMILQKNLLNARETNTNIRIKMSNELYSQIQKYADLGKKVFFMTNEAKYNDFIIHPKRYVKKKEKNIAEVSEKILVE